ncbi:hypothetical protein L1787_10065 [Acuticoccus sp. M5D2P5]|uniref:hypothetical protein n=1 Tax=Acuticoccus kalidii TaxID=2910977 RepID=UPI001F3F9B83|nr:hypothetical protein [Acuticoccus kalidii]MCF3933759.1 hypothetical protein [Acuticoccus kalidii]
MKRFPQDAERIGRLLLSHREFRSICEDHAAAEATLARIRARADADQRPEIGEYGDIIRELEAELEAILRAEREKEEADAGPREGPE